MRMNSQLLFELSIVLAVMGIIYSVAIYKAMRPKYKPPSFSFILAGNKLVEAPFPIYYAKLHMDGEWWGYQYAPNKIVETGFFLYSISRDEQRELINNYRKSFGYDGLIVELYPQSARRLDDI